MGDYSKAKPLYLQCQEIQRIAMGEDHPDYGATLNDLAGLYESVTDYTKAEPLYLQSLEITKKSLGEEHPDYATALNNLAGLYTSMAITRKPSRCTCNHWRLEEIAG